MSNIKSVHIIGTVPFDWADRLSRGEAALVARVFLSPSIGIKLTYGAESMGPVNGFGGRTAMYEFAISGEEAVSESTISLIVGIMRRVGQVKYAAFQDVEIDGPVVRL